MKKESQELTVKENNQLAVDMFSVADVAPDFIDLTSNEGNENITVNDVFVPYLVLLQSQSPQCLKASPKYINGAEAGMFMNSVTGQIYGTTVNLISAGQDLRHLLWLDRSEHKECFRGSYATYEEAEMALDALPASEKGGPKGPAIVLTYQVS